MVFAHVSICRPILIRHPLHEKNDNHHIHQQIPPPSVPYNAAYAYTWKKGGSETGTTGQTYNIASATASDAGTYTVVASSGAGCTAYDQTSDGMAIAVESPSITLNNIKANGAASTSFEIDKDESLTLAANVASSTGSLSYAWSTSSVGATDAGTSSSITPSTASAGSRTFYLQVTATSASGCEASANKSITVTVTEPLSCDYSGITQTGAIKGLFSVSSTKQVMFSMGNLQYQASTNTFRFASNQYDVIKDGAGNSTSQVYVGRGTSTGSSATNSMRSQATSNIQSSTGRVDQSAWIDLFLSGTDGVSSTVYYPWEINTGGGSYAKDYYTPSYGHNRSVTSKGSGDWGYKNRISNGGNSTSTWRVPTSEEMNYLINSRAHHDDLWAYGKVNGVSGLILLPDCWVLPAGITFYSHAWTLENTHIWNTYTTSQWTTMQNAGAVFLPAGGIMNVKATESTSAYTGSGTSRKWQFTWTITPSFVLTGSDLMNYWLAGQYYLNVTDSKVTSSGTAPGISSALYQYRGYSVRLVKDN